MKPPFFHALKRPVLPGILGKAVLFLILCHSFVSGADWPQFLGPQGNGVSPEKGITTPWPKRGLKVIWDRKVGTGYGMPTISRGRLFQFDRHGDNARLTCIKSSSQP